MNKQRTIPDDPEDDVDLSNLDDDDAPELTPEMMARAKRLVDFPELADMAELVRKGGRPLLPDEWKKRRVTIMLDPDVIARFKAGGKGWQTRMNAALRKAAGLDGD